LLDTRVIYCGDCLEQLKNLPDAWLRRAQSSRVDLIYIDPPFNSNRNYEVFCAETKENESWHGHLARERCTHRGSDEVR
jgi:16S rRNA G966 N2-methylase RsmD